MDVGYHAAVKYAVTASEDEQEGELVVRKVNRYVIEADAYERIDDSDGGPVVYTFYQGDVPVASVRGVTAIGPATASATVDPLTIMGDPAAA